MKKYCVPWCAASKTGLSDVSDPVHSKRRPYVLTFVSDRVEWLKSAHLGSDSARLGGCLHQRECIQEVVVKWCKDLPTGVLTDGRHRIKYLSASRQNGERRRGGARRRLTEPGLRPRAN
jgi:hypothetical protein